MMENKQIILKSRPEGRAGLDNFELLTVPMPSPGDGQVLLRHIYLSADPYMRARMDESRDSYVPALTVGGPVNGFAVAQVMESRHATFAGGDYVTGMLDWALYSVLDEATLSHPLSALRKVDPRVRPLSYHIGVLGMPGMTAWVGLKGIGRPEAGETVFVSAASGAVGSVVGQIGKNLGCHVAGCAGSDEKVGYLLDELGFDAAFNYKTVTDLDETLRACCPDGIDVNFENVGGAVMHAVYRHMNQYGRFILCGMIADYDPPQLNLGPPLIDTVIKRLHIQGFIVSDDPEGCMEWVHTGSRWLQAGKLKYRETVTDGLEHAPQALLGLLSGGNFGKQIIRLAAEAD